MSIFLILWMKYVSRFSRRIQYYPKISRFRSRVQRIERGKRVMRVEPGALRAHRSLFELNRVVRAAPDNASDCRRAPNCRATK